MGSSINDLSNKITHKSDLPQVNFKFGNNIEKSPSFWNIFGKGFVAGTTIGVTKALTGGIFTATQNSTTGTQTKQTQEAEQKNPVQTEYQKVAIELAQCNGNLDRLNEQLKTAKDKVTRLTKATDENEIKATGALAVVKLDNNNLQVVIGPQVHVVKNKLDKLIKNNN